MFLLEISFCFFLGHTGSQQHIYPQGPSSFPIFFQHPLFSAFSHFSSPPVFNVQSLIHKNRISGLSSQVLSIFKIGVTLRKYMPSKLIIVESPTKSKSLQNFLGKDYKVLASFGHVRDLPKSKIGIDTENNFQPEYIIMQKARKVVKEIKSSLVKADVVILATDPDREGESIAWHLTKALNLVPIKNKSKSKK